MTETTSRWNGTLTHDAPIGVTMSKTADPEYDETTPAIEDVLQDIAKDVPEEEWAALEASSDPAWRAAERIDNYRRRHCYVSLSVNADIIHKEYAELEAIRENMRKEFENRLARGEDPYHSDEEASVYVAIFGSHCNKHEQNAQPQT